MILSHLYYTYDIEPLIGSEGRVLVGRYLLVVAKAPRGAFMEKNLDCSPQGVGSVPMMPWRFEIAISIRVGSQDFFDDAFSRCE